MSEQRASERLPYFKRTRLGRLKQKAKAGSARDGARHQLFASAVSRAANGGADGEVLLRGVLDSDPPATAGTRGPRWRRAHRSGSNLA